MPQMLVRLVKAADLGKYINAEQVTGKGVDLEWHWHNQKTRDRIKARMWDYVVLQDRSGGPLENKASMFKHARLLDDDIKKQGAETILYMTWANQKRHETQKILTDAYSQISRELGAILAPVGTAWENSLKTDPDLRLHHSDDRHAGPAGAYLTACVFYTVLYRSSPGFAGGPVFERALAGRSDRRQGSIFTADCI
jgi:hypothetical protein